MVDGPTKLYHQLDTLSRKKHGGEVNETYYVKMIGNHASDCDSFDTNIWCHGTRSTVSNDIFCF